MIVCLCEGVSDRRIAEAVSGGDQSVRAVARVTGAGTGCGSCVCDVRAILGERRCARAGAAPRSTDRQPFALAGK